MSKRITLQILALLSLVLVSCSDDENFSSSTMNYLTFSQDSIALDTVFSNVPTVTKTFWVYNNSSSGIRCSDIRLERGSQSGFRVNVDGVDLSKAGSTQYVEIRKGDSIRVFVELTSKTQNKVDPNLVEDNLVFTLESGNQQKVNLNAYSWDATMLRNYHVTGEETFTGDRPVVIYGGLTVDSAATLHLSPGTTLYFHSDAALDVYGTLDARGSAESNVVLRGDRLDKMFDYLPYDLTPGQWQGLRLRSSSSNNVMLYTDLHSSFNGVTIDSCDVQPLKLHAEASMIHNCQGYGLLSNNATVELYNVQVTNTLSDCVRFEGGKAEMDNCTLAQFYPFDSNRGAALTFSNSRSPLLRLLCYNSIVTGYADDVLYGINDTTTTNAYAFLFDHCLLRTEKVTGEDTVYMPNVIYEDASDTTKGAEKNFKRIDTDSLRYDFQLDSTSVAIDAADPVTATPYDRKGRKRDDKPDMGALEFIKERN